MLATWQLGEVNEAYLAILKAIEVGEDCLSTFRLASNLSRDLGDLGKAEEFARKAIEAGNNNERTRENHLEHLARILSLKGDRKEALVTVDSLLQMDPDRASCYAIKCQLYLELNRIQDAKLTIIQAMELGDVSHSTFRLASNLFRDLGDFRNAEKFAKKAVEAADNTELSKSRHLEHLANILISKGKMDEALCAVNSALELGSDHHFIFRITSDVHRKLGDLDRALEFAMMAVDAKWSYAKLNDQGYVTEVVEKVVI